MFSYQSVLCVILLLFGLRSANATTWYVDSQASGANNGTSWLNAWKSLASISGVSAGDTVYISGGSSGTTNTYTLSASWSPVGGSAANPITYQIGQDSSHDGTAKFAGVYSWITTGNSNIVVSGDAGDGKQHFLCSCSCVALLNSVRNFRLAYVDAPSISVGPTSGNGSAAIGPGLVIDHCYFYISDTAADHFSYMAFKGGFDANSIHDCTIYVPRTESGVGADALQWNGSGFTVYDNTIVGYAANYTGGQHQDGLQPTAGSYIKVYGNTFLNIANYPVFGDAYYGGFSHFWVYNNVFVLADPNLQNSAPPQGVAIGPDGGVYSNLGYWPTISDVMVANNLFDGYVNHSSIALHNNAGQSTLFTNCIAANNIFLNSGGVWLDSSSPVVNRDNVSMTTQSALINFVSYAANSVNNNYHLLAAATKLIGQGANLSAYFSTDKDGDARPASGAWDIGPYEYNSNPGYSLTVVNGSGSGTYASNAVVTITANTVPGRTFSNWSATVQGLVANTNANSTTVRMNANVTVTANYVTNQSVSLLDTGILIAADNATITAPFELTGGYVSQLVETTNLALSGQAIFTFTVTNAGNYAVQAMVNAPADGNNSFYVNIDGQPVDPTMIWDVPVTSGFQKETVGWRGNGTDTSDQFVPKVFTLGAGTHQLIIRGREMNTQLESVTILSYNMQPPQGLRIVVSSP